MEETTAGGFRTFIVALRQKPEHEPGVGGNAMRFQIITHEIDDGPVVFIETDAFLFRQPIRHLR